MRISHFANAMSADHCTQCCSFVLAEGMSLFWSKSVIGRDVKHSQAIN